MVVSGEREWGFSAHWTKQKPYDDVEISQVSLKPSNIILATFQK